jgi:hypothetical protein
MGVPNDNLETRLKLGRGSTERWRLPTWSPKSHHLAREQRTPVGESAHVCERHWSKFCLLQAGDLCRAVVAPGCRTRGGAEIRSGRLGGGVARFGHTACVIGVWTAPQPDDPGRGTVRLLAFVQTAASRTTLRPDEKQSRSLTAAL